MAKYNSPLVLQRADPFVYKHTDGYYYFSATVPEYDRIEIRRVKKLNDLATAEPRVVWRKHRISYMSSHIWAPEIHYIMGKWVIYFAAGSLPNVWEIRPYALMCKGNDPMNDEWEECGMLERAQDDPFSFTDFSLDTTVFEHRKKWYIIWAEKVGHGDAISNLYIAELENPTKLKTVQVLLTSPDYDWERIDYWVNEGPAVIKNDGKIFVTYSASATGAMYCMGMLSADEDADLLDPRSWTKKRYPVLSTNETLKVYGPGHNCFTVGDDGEPLCMLHFRNYERIKGDPLLDHNRHAHVISVKFNADGEPLFLLDPNELYNVPFENEKQKNINI